MSNRRKLTSLALVAALLCVAASSLYEHRRFEMTNFAQNSSDLLVHYWDNRVAVLLYFASMALFGVVLGAASRATGRSAAISAAAAFGPLGFVAGIAYLIVRTRKARIVHEL